MLLQAAASGNLQLLQQALSGQLGARQFHIDINNVKTDEGITPLILAIHYGHGNIVQYLLQHGANINEPDNNGKTPLMYAVERGIPGFIHLLLVNGANVQAKDNDGNTVFIYSVKSDNAAIVNYFINNGGTDLLDQTNRNGNTAFMQAVEWGVDVSIVRVLWERQPNKDINLQNYSHYSAFTLALVALHQTTQNSRVANYLQILYFLFHIGAQITPNNVTDMLQLNEQLQQQGIPHTELQQILTFLGRQNQLQFMEIVQQAVQEGVIQPGQAHIARYLGDQYPMMDTLGFIPPPQVEQPQENRTMPAYDEPCEGSETGCSIQGGLRRKTCRRKKRVKNPKKTIRKKTIRKKTIRKKTIRKKNKNNIKKECVKK
jgi:hypothetical protein